MTTTPCYAIAEVDSKGNPVSYLPFLGGTGWEPGMSYLPTSDRAKAWRFPDRVYTQERVDVMNADGTSAEVHVIEIDSDGPPLNLTAPPSLQ